jgi:hypothetical protein
VHQWNADSSDRLRAGGSEIDSWQGQGIFLYSTASRPAPRSTQPPVQWVLGVRSAGLNLLVGESATHPHLLPRSRMVELPHTSSWHSAELVKQRDNFAFYLLLRNTQPWYTISEIIYHKEEFCLPGYTTVYSNQLTFKGNVSSHIFILRRL